MLIIECLHVSLLSVVMYFLLVLSMEVINILTLALHGFPCSTCLLNGIICWRYCVYQVKVLSGRTAHAKFQQT